MLSLALLGLAPAPPAAPDPTGEQLARIYCAICHAYPAPDLLPKAIWKDVVLPRMGQQFGIYPADGVRASLFEPGPGGERVRAAGIFPEEATLPDELWQRICQFYLDQAPDSLLIPASGAYGKPLTQFAARLPALSLSPPSTTLIRFRPDGGLWLGDANTQRMYWLRPDLSVEKAARLAEGVVDIQPDGLGAFITLMGSFSPTDAPSGAVVYLKDQSGVGQLLLENLQRPVHSTWADFNGDGRRDAVVCEYGKWTGGLSLWLQQPDGSFSKTWLRQKPGAIKTLVRDFNNDGFPDLLALFGQGDEGIFRYINDGHGHFTEAIVLRLPPTYGSSSLRLIDVNADGREDIVYTCGDNADYRPILKPYHGIYIFTATDSSAYSPALFLPLHGAYDAIPADFDRDGDLDMAAIAFFPDFSHSPAQGFVYFENIGAGQYTPHTSDASALGRWIVMDVGDIENDGDLDIALGALTFEVIPDRGEVRRWVEGGLPALILENKLK